MKVYIPEEVGFCFGVKEAIKKVERELKKGGEVFCLGDLVHNPLVMNELCEKGLKVVSSLSEVKKCGTLITRAHGVEQSILEKGKEKGLKIVETTCPYVLRAHKIIRKLICESYHVVIVGSAEHPEIKAILSDIPFCKVSVINSSERIREVSEEKKIGIVAQTTESLDNFENIVKNLIEKRLKSGFEIRVFNTVCSVVIKRQKEAKELAEKVDAVIVVGGNKSSNTRKLVEICKKEGKKVYFIEREEELEFEKIKKLSSVGIIGGTSTPEKIIRNLERKIKKIFSKEGE